MPNHQYNKHAPEERGKNAFAIELCRGTSLTARGLNVWSPRTVLRRAVILEYMIIKAKIESTKLIMAKAMGFTMMTITRIISAMNIPDMNARIPGCCSRWHRYLICSPLLPDTVLIDKGEKWA